VDDTVADYAEALKSTKKGKIMDTVQQATVAEYAEAVKNALYVFLFSRNWATLYFFISEKCLLFKSKEPKTGITLTLKVDAATDSTVAHLSWPVAIVEARDEAKDWWDALENFE
jgi:hypothetical protein